MKIICILSCLVVLGVVALPTGAEATQRVAMVETFTNTGCPFCPAANTATHAFIDAYGPQIALNVQYHTPGPSPSDPFYQANTTDNVTRMNYYNIGGVPSVLTDGQDTATGSYEALQSAVSSRLPLGSPFDITVGTSLVGNDMTVDVEITATDDVPASGLALHIALVEPYVHYATPPGSNGETDFFCTMRDMLPSGAGQTLSISNGQTLYFSETGTLNPAWAGVYAVVWVQNNADKTVMQAASSLPADDFMFFYGATQAADVAPMGLYSFPSFLQNRGVLNDRYDVHVDWDVPPTWGGAVCEGGNCHLMGENDFDIRLDAGLETPVSVDIEPFGAFGQGSCTVTVTSQGDPGLQWSKSFTLISIGTPILVVDDDGGFPYEAYFEEALDATGYLYGTWDLDNYGKLDAATLDYFHVVIWNVGWAFPSIEADDRAALATFLDNGGRLFLSGQDIGWDFFDASGSQYGTAAQDWYRNYLGAVYQNDDTNDLTLQGVAGDPIGDGLSFLIVGGTGASNQDYPSEIEPYGGGVGCIEYTPGVEAAVRLDSGAFKSVYFAFGYEGVADVTVRATLMQRILDWFEIDLVPVPGERIQQPFLAGVPAAEPNPFNPATTIAFDIGGSLPAPVEVAVYDVRGRLVRELWRGPVQPGHQEISWDGRTESGRQAASGVYLARLKVAGEQRTLKMTLAK